MHDGSNKMHTSFLCYHFYTELEFIFSHAHCLYDYPEKKATNGPTFLSLGGWRVKKLAFWVGWKQIYEAFFCKYFTTLHSLPCSQRTELQLPLP